ncbi:hypothetical protein HDE_00525 [Halotydeus destructor]|nr:hypothetical protein HDE_00525 [Halotydeus destructor]
MTNYYLITLYLCLIAISKSDSHEHRCSLNSICKETNATEIIRKIIHLSQQSDNPLIRDNYLDCLRAATGNLETAPEIVIDFCLPSKQDAAKNATSLFFDCFAERGLSKDELIKLIGAACDY